MSPKLQDAGKRALRRWEDEERKQALANELAKRAVSKGIQGPHDVEPATEKAKKLAKDIYKRLQKAEEMAAHERGALMRKNQGRFRIGGPRNIEDFSRAIADKFKPMTSKPRRDRG